MRSTPGLVTTARIRLPAGMLAYGLVLAGNRAAWAGCRPCTATDDVRTGIYLLDLPAGRPHRVVDSAFEGGSTTVVGLAEDVLVWVDVVTVGAGARFRWALRSRDLRSGVTRTLAEGGQGRGRTGTAVPFVAAGRIGWQLLDDASMQGPVHVTGLRGGRVRTVTPRLPGLLRGATTDGLVYTASDPGLLTVVPDADVPVDAYLLPWAGGAPRPLTTTHDVEQVSVAVEGFAWSTPPGDHETTYWRPFVGAPISVFTGPVLDLAAGHGFVARVTRAADGVVQVATGGRSVTMGDVPADPSGLAADGDTFAVLTLPDRGIPGPLILVVTRVTPAPA